MFWLQRHQASCLAHRGPAMEDTPPQRRGPRAVHTAPLPHAGKTRKTGTTLRPVREEPSPSPDRTSRSTSGEASPIRKAKGRRGTWQPSDENVLTHWAKFERKCGKGPSHKQSDIAMHQSFTNPWSCLPSFLGASTKAKYHQNLAAYFKYLSETEGYNVEAEVRDFGQRPYRPPPMPHNYFVEREKTTSMRSQILCSLLSFYKYLIRYCDTVPAGATGDAEAERLAKLNRRFCVGLAPRKLPSHHVKLNVRQR